jgi:hypothetical protein
MGMSQQQLVDAGGIEPEIVGIFLGEFAAPLAEAAIHQVFFTRAFHQVTGTRHPSNGAMKGDVHVFFLVAVSLPAPAVLP